MSLRHDSRRLNNGPGILKNAFGNYNEKELKKLWPIVVEVNESSPRSRPLSDAELAAKTLSSVSD